MSMPGGEYASKERVVGDVCIICWLVWKVSYGDDEESPDLK